MKSKTIALIALLSANLFCYSQVVELPLTVHNGYGPFSMGFGGASPIPENENNPWKNSYLKVSKFPQGLTEMKYGNFETNIYQSVYQDYLSGNITKEWYNDLQKSWSWIPDTLNLSKIPVKTKIAFAYGKDLDGNLKIVVDTNNNLDLSDDKLFSLPEMSSFYLNYSQEQLSQTYAVNVSFEIYSHNKIVSVNAPLVIVFNNFNNSVSIMYNFSQYLTTQFKDEPIAVSSSNFTNLSYNDIGVIFINSLKDGEKVDRENILRKNEYIEIKDDIYKIIGVNTNRNTLVLEKINLPKTQIFSTQIGYKSHLFQEKKFTTEATISLESLKGKYVLLDFWAEWCGPCIQEFSTLKELYAKTDREKFEIIGIAGRSTSEGIKKLIDRHTIVWPQILSDTLVKMYGVNSFPTTILLDTNGTVISKDLRGKKLEEEILNLLK